MKWNWWSDIPEIVFKLKDSQTLQNAYVQVWISCCDVRIVSDSRMSFQQEKEMGTRPKSCHVPYKISEAWGEMGIAIVQKIHFPDENDFYVFKTFLMWKRCDFPVVQSNAWRGNENLYPRQRKFLHGSNLQKISSNLLIRDMVRWSPGHMATWSPDQRWDEDWPSKIYLAWFLREWFSI